MTIKRTASDREVMEPNAPTRGRKRFQYDLQKAEKAAEQGVEVNGLRLLGALLSSCEGLYADVARVGVSRGDEDGSFDCSIVRDDGEFVAALTFLVSGTSLAQRHCYPLFIPPLQTRLSIPPIIPSSAPRKTSSLRLCLLSLTVCTKRDRLPFRTS